MATETAERTKEINQEAIGSEVVENTALARRPGAAPMSPDEWKMIGEQSKVYAAAGIVLPEWIQKTGKMAVYVVAAVISKGREIGLQPMYSLENVSLIKGKTMVSSQALLALIQSRHGRTAVTPIETTEEKATFSFRDPQHPEWQPPDITVSLKQAKDRGWTMGPKGEQPAWKNMPATMLRWRCIAEGARLYFADTIGGIYLAGEIEGVPYKVEGGNLEVDFEAIEGELVHREDVSANAFDSNGHGTEAADEAAAEPPHQGQVAVASDGWPAQASPTDAQWATLEGVIGELQKLDGKDPTKWRGRADKGAHATFGKTLDTLTRAEAQQLIELAASQRDIMANSQEAPLADLEDVAVPPEQPELSDEVTV